MSIRILYVLLLQGACTLLSAQSTAVVLGARAHAMGNAQSCLHDEWSTFNNPGGLAALEKTTASATYKISPLLSNMNQLAAVVATPMKTGVAALGVYRFGDKLYNEQIITAGYSNSFGIASLGATINYIQYQAEGFGSRGMVSFNFGGITKLGTTLSIGAFIRNINQPYISQEKKERLPTVMAIGLGYQMSEHAFATTEVEKYLDHTATIKAGLEYSVFKKVFFRTGFNVYPGAAFFGAGFRKQSLKIDYAIQFLSALGTIHQATVGYQIRH